MNTNIPFNDQEFFTNQVTRWFNTNMVLGNQNNL